MLKAQIRKRLGELSLSIDLSVAKGITVLRGESGSGKTTIANLLSGALKPDEGEIELEGRSVFSTVRGINLAPEARGIGFVFKRPVFCRTSLSKKIFAFLRRPAGADRELISQKWWRSLALNGFSIVILAAFPAVKDSALHWLAH